MLSICPFDISVGIRAFVIGLSQISSFFLLASYKYLNHPACIHTVLYNFTKFNKGSLYHRAVALVRLFNYVLLKRRDPKGNCRSHEYNERDKKIGMEPKITTLHPTCF